MTLFSETIRDRASAERFIEWCIDEIGSGFHPDTSFTEYVALASGEPVFDQIEAERLEELLNRTFDFCDPYEVGLAAVRRRMQLDL